MRGATTYDRAVLFWSVFQSTPLMRGATMTSIALEVMVEFQSTPLMRGATVAGDGRRRAARVSIHAPHARGDTNGVLQSAALAVSIHAPHARGDELVGGAFDAMSQFQSTPLMRGETCRIRHGEGGTQVSIHAPHARGDVLGLRAAPAVQVSIHAPHARGDHV